MTNADMRARVEFADFCSSAVTTRLRNMSMTCEKLMRAQSAV